MGQKHLELVYSGQPLDSVTPVVSPTASKPSQPAATTARLEDILANKAKVRLAEEGPRHPLVVVR